MKIGVLVNNIDGRYQTQILRGIQDFARLFKARAVVFNGRSFQSPYPDDRLHNQVYSLALDAQIDGYLVVAGAIGTNIDDEGLAAQLEPFRQRPLVTIGRTLPGLPGLASRDAQGLSEAIDHLVTGHGSRRIGFVSGPPQDPSSRLRLDAYRAGLERHGLGYRPDLVYWGDYSFQCCPGLAKQMLASPRLPFDALVCANDEMAVGIQQHLQLAGIRSPQDYALVGFDDLPAFSQRSPGLTTVRQPLYEQTMAAGSHLIALIRHTDPRPLVDLPSSFVCRETCGCSPIPILASRQTRPEEDRHLRSSLDAPTFLEAFLRTSILSPSVRHEIEKLVPTLLGALELDLRSQRGSPLFLQSLNEWLEMTFEWERYGETWQALLARIQGQVTSEDLIPRDQDYRTWLMSSAQTLLARRCDQRGAQRLTETSDQSAQFRWFSRQLAQTQRAGEILPALLSSSVTLGITSATVLPDGAVDLGGNNPLTPEDQEIMVLPLVAQSRHFGTLVLTGRGIDPVVYATIQEEVSQAHFLCALFEERQAVEDQKLMALEKHRRSEERYKEMAQMVPMLMWETDGGLLLTYQNRAAEKCLGLSLGQSLKPRIADGDRGRLDTVLAGLVDGSEVSLPALRIQGRQSEAALVVVQLTAIRVEGDSGLGLRWHALDPQPLALESTLPDAAFLESHHISGRETEVLTLVLYGLRSREIAKRLSIAESTVKGHLGHLFDKFGVDSREGLADHVHQYQVDRYGQGNYLLMILNRLLAGESSPQ